jgi:ectoine hydroxylase-related dioxygenase (phytanoyl-CoA dioxygenase family)
MPNPLITAADIATFQREGAVVLRNVISPDWIVKLAEGVAENIAKPGPYGKDHADGGSAYFGDYCNWQRIGVFRDVAEQGPLGAVAGALMGSARVQLFHEHVLVKEPGNGSATPWHQDQPYYSVDGDQTVSLWVPLDPVIEPVCPRFLAGSHADGKLYVPKRFKTGAALEGDTAHYTPFDGVDETGEKDRLRSWGLQPGDAIAFNFKTLHNAPPNTSANRRRAISFRFVGDDARYATRSHAVSPPFPDMGVTARHGDAMPTDRFPVVWSH